MNEVIAIIGGSGFVGRELTAALRQQGYTVRVISRRSGTDSEDCQWRLYNPENEESLVSALADCYAVVNLVGILNTRLFHPQDFYYTHVILLKRILSICKRNRIRRYLHMSALNADPQGPSEYLRTKGEGEMLAHSDTNIRTTSFRPSVIFGHGDGLLNRFAQILRVTPWIFPLACADALFAPVYVRDVVNRMVNSVCSDDAGEKIALCGPNQYTLREIVEYTARLLNKDIKVIELPESLSKAQAYILGIIPGKPFSIDNYRSLQLDSICTNTIPCSTRLEDIGPSYIKQ